MRTLFLLLVLLVSGCAKPHRESTPPTVPQYTIFDEALAKPEFADDIKQAQRDLPGDDWMTEPFRLNRSRGQRERQVATNILAMVEPKLKQMSVTELVHSLKIEMSPTVLITNDFTGVSGHVYRGGYSLVKKEIRSRPRKDLQVLPSLADDYAWLYTGPQGPTVTLKSFVHHDLFEE